MARLFCTGAPVASWRRIITARRCLADVRQARQVDDEATAAAFARLATAPAPR